MAAHRQPSFGLRSSADKNVERLGQLKQRAELARGSRRTTPTKKILGHVIHDVNDSLRALQAWIKEFSKGEQTDNFQVIQTVQELFSRLQSYVNAAHDSLDSRLARRKLLSRKSFERALDKALEDVSDTISDLQNALKVIRIGSAKQVERESRKQGVLSGASNTYNTFFERLNHIAVSQRPIRASALELLWENIPLWKELDGKVGNKDDPGDGLMYNEERVANAKSMLEDLHRAWHDADTLNYSPPPAKLPEMAKIYLIVSGMKRQGQGLFEDFLESDYADNDLPLEKRQLEATLKGPNTHYTSTFFSEQYRAVPRMWEEGCHLEIDDEEPLPLIHEFFYREGSYGTVHRVRDSFSGDLYARKQQIVDLEDKITAAAEKHLKDETKRLRDLRHRHVVQLVKSYKRGKAYGILLRPAATSDLRKLLDRFYEDKFCGTEGCNDSVWLRPLFLTAFGCLSRGLAYIHGRDIRHKDVKPANILYERALRNNDHAARFLWADFGLAYDFSEKGDSRTRSQKLYSVLYAPPEVVTAHAKIGNKDRRSSVATKLEEIVENEDRVLIAAEISPQEKHEELDSHGRSADIFSLGCIFLELLAHLMREKLPLRKKDEENEEEKMMFSNNIPALSAWAQQKQKFASATDFKALFPLAVSMISTKPDDRPLIGDVVNTIATDVTLGAKYFCASCWEELAKEVSSKPMGQSSRSLPLHSPKASSARVTRLSSPGPSSPKPSSPGPSSMAVLEKINSLTSGPLLKRVLSAS